MGGEVQLIFNIIPGLLHKITPKTGEDRALISRVIYSETAKVRRKLVSFNPFGSLPQVRQYFAIIHGILRFDRSILGRAGYILKSVTNGTR